MAQMPWIIPSFVIISVLSIWALDGTHINGRAVSVNWLYAPLSGGIGQCHADGSWAGSKEDGHGVAGASKCFLAI